MPETTEIDECYAELVDGSWTYCGCPECYLEEHYERTGQVGY